MSENQRPTFAGFIHAIREIERRSHLPPVKYVFLTPQESANPTEEQRLQAKEAERAFLEAYEKTKVPQP